MANFEEFKQKAADAAEVIAGKTVELAVKAADKTKVFARITKLTAENTADKERSKKVFEELGRLYYDAKKDCPDDFLAQSVAEQATILSRIADRNAEIAQLKSKQECCEDAEDAKFVEESEEAPAEEKCCGDCAAPDDETPKEE